MAAGLSACLLLMQTVVPASIPVVNAEEKLRENKVSITEVYGSEKQDAGGLSFIEVHNGTEEAKSWKDLGITYTTDQEQKLTIQEQEEQIPAGGYAVLALNNETTVETFNSHFGTELTDAAFTNVTEPYIFQDDEQQLSITDTTTEQTSVSVFHFRDVEQTESIHFANDSKNTNHSGSTITRFRKIEQAEQEETAEDSQQDTPEEDVKEAPVAEEQESEPASESETKIPLKKNQLMLQTRSSQLKKMTVNCEKGEQEKTSEPVEPAQEEQPEQPVLVHEAITNADSNEVLPSVQQLKTGMQIRQSSHTLLLLV